MIEKLIDKIKGIGDSGIAMLECVFNPVNGNSVCIHVHTGVDVLENTLIGIEYPYVDVVISYLRGLTTRGDHVYVNLGSDIKVYWNDTLDGKIHGVYLTTNGEAYGAKKYITKQTDGALSITKISEIEEINYAAVKILPMFSSELCDGVQYCGFRSDKSRYYALIGKSAFPKYEYALEVFLRNLIKEK